MNVRVISTDVGRLAAAVHCGCQQSQTADGMNSPYRMHMWSFPSRISACRLYATAIWIALAAQAADPVPMHRSK
eukprot:2570834-Amphidinium_carterae.2